MNRYKAKEYKKTVFVNDLDKVAKLLADLTPDSNFQESWSDVDRQFAAGLRLVYDAIIDKEMQRRPSQMNLS